MAASFISNTNNLLIKTKESNSHRIPGDHRLSQSQPSAGNGTLTMITIAAQLETEAILPMNNEVINLSISSEKTSIFLYIFKYGLDF